MTDNTNLPMGVTRPTMKVDPLYVVSVVCKHDGGGSDAPPREVCALVYADSPVWRDGPRWSEVAHERCCFEDWRSYELYADQGMQEFRWNFICEDCGCTVPVHDSRLKAALEPVKAAGFDKMYLHSLA